LERAQEEETRWHYYKTIPQHHWEKMSSRQRKTLRDQAERYGIPFGQRTIDLSQVVPAIHDFLTRNAHVLDRTGAGDPLLTGCSSPALERYREQMYQLARLKVLQQQGHLLHRDRVHDALARIASIVRGAGETIQRYSQPAYHVLEAAFDRCQCEVDAMFPIPQEAAAPS